MAVFNDDGTGEWRTLDIVLAGTNDDSQVLPAEGGQSLDDSNRSGKVFPEVASNWPDGGDAVRKR